ncbi:MAG: hypothetical protein JWQ13_2629 [Ramlibacter sp.]|jgi:hypothetical protein|nr:hypothetical protein [Ramlibacter sp.]
MPRAHTPSRHLIGNRVASAKSRTEKVQEDIQLAEAELHLASKVITDKLAEKATDADLAKAVAHNDQIEEKLRDAGEELKVVNELLTSEERDRKQLEQSLQELREGDGPSLAGSRSGEGSASVIDHLRELTRHKLNSDHAVQPARDAASPGKL